MGRTSSGPANEYDGTGSNSGDPILGGSGPIDAIDPATLGGGTGGGSDEQFDARIHVSPDKRNANGSYTRKRGRKSGSGSASPGAGKAKAAGDLKTSVDALSKTLVILHVGLAGITGSPEFVIDKDEGDLLANSAVNVMQHFDLTPDPKVQAIVGLVMASATVYAPRAYMIKARKEQEKKEKAAGATGAGVGGVYTADGQAMGTAPFSVVN